MTRLSQLHPLLVQILFNRGVTDPEEADAFLNGRARFDDPSRMRGVPAAVARIRAAIRAGEPIVVYGDFDADGVTSTALLVQALTALGAHVSPYIPHRVDEGYGLHNDALDRIAAAGARLVITVDCGIRSPVEVAHGHALGLDMIVTDHHSIQLDADGRDLLPPALAVINPKQQADHYPFRDFAGVGLAFKLAQALLLAEQREPILPAPRLSKSAICWTWWRWAPWLTWPRSWARIAAWSSAAWPSSTSRAAPASRRCWKKPRWPQARWTPPPSVSCWGRASTLPAG